MKELKGLCAARLRELHEELVTAWKAAEAMRFDDPFAGRAMIRLGKALVAYHEQLRSERQRPVQAER